MYQYREGCDMAKRGRPKAENPRSYTLSEVRVTREEQRMAKLKADLYFNGSTAELLRKSIKEFKSEIPIKNPYCPECDSSEVSVVFVDETDTFTVADIEHEVTVKGVPATQCTNCGAVYKDLRLSTDLWKEVNEEIVYRLNARKPLMKEVHFNDLLNGKPID